MVGFSVIDDGSSKTNGPAKLPEYAANPATTIRTAATVLNRPMRPNVPGRGWLFRVSAGMLLRMSSRTFPDPA
jgi:hypothetical protein